MTLTLFEFNNKNMIIKKTNMTIIWYHSSLNFPMKHTIYHNKQVHINAQFDWVYFFNFLSNRALTDYPPYNSLCHSSYALYFGLQVEKINNIICVITSIERKERHLLCLQASPFRATYCSLSCVFIRLLLGNVCPKVANT